MSDTDDLKIKNTFPTFNGHIGYEGRQTRTQANIKDNSQAI